MQGLFKFLQNRLSGYVRVPSEQEAFELIRECKLYDFEGREERRETLPMFLTTSLTPELVRERIVEHLKNSGYEVVDGGVVDVLTALRGEVRWGIWFTLVTGEKIAQMRVSFEREPNL